MRKHVRYLILLLILLFVALNEMALRLHTASWERPLEVHIYAISGDDRAASQRYVASLDSDDFKTMERFVNREARRYELPWEAIRVTYQPGLDSPPPQPPSGDNILENILWSLRFRAWAWRRQWGGPGDADIALYVNYYDTATSQSLRHSVGLRGGFIGIINAFADPTYRGSNHVVIVHELMHTLGATDKYGADNLPRYPEGYAEPYRQPLLPQRLAEIMGGRIPLSTAEARMPRSLAEVTIGPITAAEIYWIGD